MVHVANMDSMTYGNIFNGFKLYGVWDNDTICINHYVIGVNKSRVTIVK